MEMTKITLPEDAVQITSYNKHELEGLYYSPSQRCFFNSYKSVRKINLDGKNGFYTRKKTDNEKVRSIYISMIKLLKEHNDLKDIIEWSKPERKPTHGIPVEHNDEIVNAFKSMRNAVGE